jgi:hypothetical protein
MIAQFKDKDFQFGLEVALGCTYRQAADVGEVLATASRITDGDADSWVHEWTATADASWTAGCQAQATGRRVSAVAHYRIDDQGCRLAAAAMLAIAGACSGTDKRLPRGLFRAGGPGRLVVVIERGEKSENHARKR